MINRDPSKKVEVPSHLVEAAFDTNAQIVHVICDHPNAQVDDVGGVNFLALSPFIPRIGEMIDLEDGSQCKVEQIFHRVCRSKKKDNGLYCLMLVPNVYAVLVDK